MENPSSLKSPPGKVLIVDDEPDTLEIIRRLLQFEGFEILTAPTGEEGVKKVEEEHPEVVLMDISLPGIDGNEAVRRIKKVHPFPSVIMLTAYATVDNAIRALKQGASDFVKKPFENDHLIHIVHQALEKYRALMMFDLDNFKRYNDRYGHLEGDKVLKKIGEIVNQLIRNNVDSGYRYGGDEFAILLIGASIDQALVIAERVRSSIEGAGFQDITVSIGLSEFLEHFTLESFVKSADDATYIAKHSGGNRVYTNLP